MPQLPEFNTSYRLGAEQRKREAHDAAATKEGEGNTEIKGGQQGGKVGTRGSR